MAGIKLVAAVIALGSQIKRGQPYFKQTEASGTPVGGQELISRQGG
jgi:hypothetical protein